jgi:3-oxoacyl-[acyl-carrier protein] reductase
MDLGLKGRVALVAAASKGLGYGVARALALEGAHVSICSRTEGEIQASAGALREETGAPVLATACDMSSADSIEAWVERTASEWGQIDAVLVNAGGPPAVTSFKDIADSVWLDAFNLTVMSSIRLIRAALPHMKQGGAILTITSSTIQEPTIPLLLSTVMRAGVAGLVKTLADDLAPQGIRVNNLIPGRIATDRVAQLDQKAAERQGISFDEARAQSVAKIPLKRLGEIDEFGAAAAFLLSPAAGYITGASLRVDGGVMRSITA